MKFLCAALLAAATSLAAAQNGSTNASSAKHAVAAAEVNPKQRPWTVYHAGPWEESIGYAQAVRVGDTIYVSGTVGADKNGFPPDLESQLKLSYEGIKRTLAHYGADLSNVAMERIQTTDMDALIKAQETRKGIYGDWRPAATWLEVKRLYTPEAKIEIEVTARLDK